eukprot:jgi/Ulvmu1/4063/UM019_0041.1
MDLLDELDSELNALRDVLGDDYEQLAGEQVQVRHEPPVEGADDYNNSDQDNDCERGSDAEHGYRHDQPVALEAGCTSDTLLQHVDAALETNAALSSKLQRIIEHVQRRIRENDATQSAIKAAQSVDRNLGRPAASLQFSWQMRHSSAVAQQRASTSRFLSSTGQPAPPISTFWSRGGVAPAPNDDACALARLFWRNPASARPPPPWTPAEKLQLRQAIRSQVVAQQQSCITADFQHRVKRGESANALKPQLLAGLAALKDVSADDVATLQQADSFTRSDWHAVSQQLQDRPADDCKVHFHAHLHPSFSQDFHRPLTPEEQAALRAAVEQHGLQQWPRVAADTGLRWPPWRLLQCYHAAVREAEGADAAAEWDAALDDKLIKAAMELTGLSNNDRRRVSWLRVAHAVGGGVSAEACQQRFCHLQNTHALRGTFSPQESAALREAVQEHGDRWSKVAEHVPGRTPRQCAEHYIFLASRSVRDMSSVWSRSVELKLLEVRAKHCPGMRAPGWEAVAREMSEAAGLQLSVEDCKRKSKLLIRRLHHSGLPERATVDAQWRYAVQNPDALTTVEDRRRQELQKWAAERGLSMRPQLPKHERPASPGAAAPTAAVANEAPALLQQSRYLRALAGLSATPGGLEVHDDPPAGTQPESAAASGGAVPGAADAEDEGGVDSESMPVGALPVVDPARHPVAAAVIRLVRARAGCSAGSAQLDDAVQARPLGQDDAVLGIVGPRQGDANEKGEGAGPIECGGGGGGAGDGTSSWALQVCGAMSEGRRLEDVKTCAERRKARIRTLHQRGLLRVMMRMPQWRQDLAAAAATAAQPRKRKRAAKPVQNGAAEQLLQLREDQMADAAPSGNGAEHTPAASLPGAATVVLQQHVWPSTHVPAAQNGTFASSGAPCARVGGHRTKRPPRPRTAVPQAAVNGGCGAEADAVGVLGVDAQQTQRPVAGDATGAARAKGPQPARAPPAGCREVLAASAQAREGPGSRRSGRKRKLTSKANPNSHCL